MAFSPIFFKSRDSASLYVPRVQYSPNNNAFCLPGANGAKRDGCAVNGGDVAARPRAGFKFDLFESESDLRRYLSLPFSVCAAAAFLALAGCSTYDSVTTRLSRGHAVSNQHRSGQLRLEEAYEQH